MVSVGRSLVGLLAISGLAGCATESRDSDDAPTQMTTLSQGAQTDSSASGPGDTTGYLDVGNGTGGVSGGGDEGVGCEAEDILDPNATLEGTVFAPNLEIPISGAVVYITDRPIPDIPDESYCSECVELECDVNFVLTEADGTFSLPAVAGPGQQLVVQKGEFRHVVDFDVAEGMNTVAPMDSSLPGRWDPANGMWIPRIAVYDADPDRVYNVLAKFGLGEVSASGDLVPGTEQFDLISSANGSWMDDLNNLRPYHIVFVPCATTSFWLEAPSVPGLRAQNIRDYVAGGGKWYATDHANEYISVPFDPYVDFHNEAMPDLQPAFDVEGEVLDADMLAWLQALPAALKDIGGGYPTLNQLPQVELELNYSGIDAVHEVMVENDEGELVNVGPYTYVEGPCTSCSDPGSNRPMAFVGQFGCGRMMYSTFETSSVAHAGLSPQELALLYMILEIGVCHDTPPPQPPPVG